MHPTNVVAAAGAGGELVAIYVLTAGASGSQIGFSRPFGQGTIDPDVPLFGDFVLEPSLTDSNRFFFGSSPVIQPNDDTSWERTEITGTFSFGTGVAIYRRADAISYTPVTGAVTQWEFGTDAALRDFIQGNVYDVRTFRPQ